ncbi:MAG: coiled-coil domain-containing protein, partial [Actinomycetota bacterium]
MPRAFAAVVLVVATLATSGSLTPTRAQPDSDDLESARSRLDELEGNLSALISRHESARQRLESVDANVVRVEGEARRLARRILKERELATQLARELYKEGNGAGMEALLGSRSLGEMEDALEYLGSSQRSHAEVFERLAADRELLGKRLQELET